MTVTGVQLTNMKNRHKALNLAVSKNYTSKFKGIFGIVWFRQRYKNVPTLFGKLQDKLYRGLSLQINARLVDYNEVNRRQNSGIFKTYVIGNEFFSLPPPIIRITYNADRLVDFYVDITILVHDTHRV